MPLDIKINIYPHLRREEFLSTMGETWLYVNLLSSVIIVGTYAVAQHIPPAAKGHNTEVAQSVYMKLVARMPDISSLHENSSADYAHVEGGRFYRRNFFVPSGEQLKHWLVDSSGYNNALRYSQSSGEVTVHEDGLYLIYAQLSIATSLGAASIKLVDVENLRSQTLAQCVTTKTAESFRRGQGPTAGTCFTSGVTPLQAGQRVFIASGYSGTGVTLSRETTFWGLVRLQSI